MPTPKVSYTKGENMKKIIITTGDESGGIFEEEFMDDKQIIAYLEDERAGGKRWIKAWVQEEENIFRDYEDPKRRRSIPYGAIQVDAKKILQDKEGHIIGHYRVDQSTPIHIFYQGKPYTKAMLEKDPHLKNRIDDILPDFKKGRNEIQNGKEVLERWDIRLEREIKSVVYYQEYSHK